MTLASLIAAQNPDGGWPYRSGVSWTEPTTLALLAQLADSGARESAERGLQWLCSVQRPDGGWPPERSVDQSTWVTALVALLPASRIGARAQELAIQWLVRQTSQDSTWVYQLRQRLLGRTQTEAGGGWPWFPGTAAWVTPTALAILALRKAERRRANAEFRQRIETGRQFLLSRMCSDGGWNHGSARALGYDAHSYPETTGVALLALDGSESPKLAQGIAAAERHLGSCQSAEGWSWLRLALAAHRRPLANVARAPACRTVSDEALFLLAQAAERGSNAFTN